MNNINFEELGLSSNVLKSIEKLGFTEPSKIQKEIIPLIMEGYDVIGQAQTGTGKTLAFAASILSKIDVSTNVVKAIVLTPTRELAIQVSKEFEILNSDNKLKVLAVYGGSSLENQLKDLRRGIDVVVGTPGRVMDLMRRGALNTKHLEYFVLDEADEMLNMGFLEDIETIFNETNENKQVLLFSATMPKTIQKLAEKYMKADYEFISIEEISKTSINVTQSYFLVNNKTRLEALCRVIDAKNPKAALIFCQTKRDVDSLLTELASRGYSAEAMHGDIAQATRIQTLDRFKQGSFKLLIATDVAARGIHVDNIDCVINYNLPQDVEAYVHRIGRTGRASKKGEAFTFVDPRDIKFIEEVMRVAQCEITKKDVPTSVDIVNSKYEQIIAKTLESVQEQKHTDAIKYVVDMNKSDLMNFSAALLKNMFDKEIGSNLNKDLEVKQREIARSNANYTRVFLTIGKIDDVRKGTLLDFIYDTTKIRKENFQNIDVLEKFTFMDVTNKEVEKFISLINNKKLNNHVIRIEKAKKRA